jgi:polyisoprenoid-binding protein YceI
MKQFSDHLSLTISAIIFPVLFSLAGFNSVHGQMNYAANGSVKTTVQGTSNIHDWEMSSAKGSFTAQLTMDAAGDLTGIGNVSFSMPVNTLKSSHGNQMDNNAYKAMNAEKFPMIRFNGNGGTVRSTGSGNYSLTVPGKLSISSGSKDVTLTASCKINADKSVVIDGSYRLNTRDYNVPPISIMLGAIKTGENVTIKYNLAARQQ